jgi:D-threo-aldose 1-dehydrogenase
MSETTPEAAALDAAALRPAVRGLPAFGYGAANLGNLYRELSDEQCTAILEAAWQAGVRYFDTAPHYGLGLSERRLGAFLATKPRDEYVVSTKVGRLIVPNPAGAGTLDTANDFHVPADRRREWDFTADGIRRSLHESLERLGLDRVDVLFLHDPEKHDLDAADRLAYPALVALREEGLVDAVGVGSMSVAALARAARTPELDVLMIAGRLTLAEQPVAGDVLDACHANGIGIVAAGVFNSGLLAGAAPSAASRYEYGQTPPELLEKVRQIADVCERFGVDLPTAALHYPFTIEGVASVVVGGSRPEQLAQNVQKAAAGVPAELWHALRADGLIEA